MYWTQENVVKQDRCRNPHTAVMKITGTRSNSVTIFLWVALSVWDFHLSGPVSHCLTVLVFTESEAEPEKIMDVLLRTNL